VFICYIILLLLTSLLLIGYLPLNATVLVFLVEILNPYFDILSNLFIDFCNTVSDSAIITDHLQKEVFLFLSFSLFVSLVYCLCSILKVFHLCTY
jgi:hypothetical protein